MIVETGNAVLNQALAELDKHYSDAMDRAQAQAVQSLTQPLYHYTDLMAFEQIVTKERFWMFDYRHLSDTQELRHGLKIAKEILSELRTIPKTRTRTRLLQRFGHASKFLSEIGLVDRLFEVFIGCFTRHVDDLAHWRTFGRGCTGIAFGMNPSFFVRDPSVPMGDKQIEKLFVHPVTYGSARRQQSVTIDDAKTILTRPAVMNAVTAENHHKFFGALCTSVACQLLWNAIMGKRQKFEVEDEVRLMVTGPIEGLKDDVRLLGTRRYVPVEMLFKGKSNLADVVVGALAPADHDDRVRMILDSVGLGSVPIRRSTKC